MSSGTMTVAEYAAHRGCSDSYIRRMRRQGKLVVAPGTSRIVVADSDALLDDITDPVRGGDRTREAAAAAVPVHTHVVPPSAPSVQEAVRRERLAKAQLAELELGELTRALTRTVDVERTTFTLVRAALNEMMGMSGRLRAKLAATTDPAACAALLDAEVRLIAARMQEAAQRLAAERNGSRTPAPPADAEDEEAAGDDA
ncbi:hypothetical protein QFW80_16685 [Luteimonas sp. M1R5S18]|uniref:Terminase small subunit n=1 Tax=Luteimonas rhizosphaericola TaxID=3042024 RepID=A0ABT6JPW6_9GAMM|nr:hypothetical protein [Luteimonas rhizosphaericola]MDH5832156.1 hypothetical protein [Luteimonas rhizosphaericola]